MPNVIRLRKRRRINMKKPAKTVTILPNYNADKKRPILVVLDPIIGAKASKYPLNKKQLNWLGGFMKAAGVTKKDVTFVSACPPVTQNMWERDKLMGEHAKAYRQVFTEFITAAKPNIIIPMGKWASRQTLGKAVQITKIRGIPFISEEFNTAILPTLGMYHVMRMPENESIFKADIDTLGRIKRHGYDIAYEAQIEKHYEWRTDISDLLTNKPSEICLDTEGVGLRPYDPATKVLTVQISTQAGHAISIPIGYNPFDKKGQVLSDDKWVPGRKLGKFTRKKLIRQLRELLEDPKVKVFGHNIKFDYQMLKHRLGIKIANVSDDTLNMVHAVDENMLSKSLSDITRRFVPAMSGYSDEFDKDPIHQQKKRMDLVPPSKMLEYGCGDADAGMRNKIALTKTLKKDKAAYKCYRLVVMNAVRAFGDIEYEGFLIDVDNLRKFELFLRGHQKKERTALLRGVADSIKDKYRDTGSGLELSRAGLLRDVLFLHEDGLQLTPRVFTKATKEPSVSTKKHLPYFEDNPYVKRLMAYIKNQKLLGTYVGTEKNEDGFPTGFYKYIFDSLIRPSYLFHRTKTGRSASVDPNGQNFPKRGDFAKRYREIFVAPPGHVLLEVDYSQVELRIVAILAKEPTMLKLFKEGADIHSATAAYVTGITLEQFNALPKKERALKRFQAKAINFGLVYGMGWRGFRAYARTEYGADCDFTEEEAQAIVKKYFRLYRALRPWHRLVGDLVKVTGEIRCIDGRVRHLPSVNSDDDNIVHQAIRQAVNSPVQGFASDLGLMSIARIHKSAPRDLVRVIGFIHDAIVCVARADQAKKAAKIIKKFMETNPLDKWFGFKSPIPLPADISIGYNLANMLEIEDSWLHDKKLVSFDDIVRAKVKLDERRLYTRSKTKRSRVRLRRAA